jgi:HJR/Mrr/RecB family endonuclease
LQKLLAVRGFQFDQDEIRWLVADELDKQNYQAFRARILSSSPKSLDGFIRTFLDAYWGESDHVLRHLAKVIEEAGITPPEMTSLRYEVQRVREAIELERFAESLIANRGRISVEALDTLSGREFEGVLVRLFRRMGYSVEETKVSGDQGADLVLSKFGEKTVVQAKRSRAAVGNTAVQEAVAAVRHYGADHAMVISTSEFTRSAQALAKSNSVELVGRAALQAMLERHYRG